jgi:uncharacterized surface protein with fasciclin (FAS1) repeats
MKTRVMKTYPLKYSFAGSLFALLWLVSGCELVGLKVQKDYQYQQKVLDPTINKTAQEFLTVRTDTLLSFMVEAIQYAGIDPAEYSKPNRTFLLLHNRAILRYDSKGAVDKTCFFGKNTVNGKPGTKWQDYPVEKVRDLLLYHIIEGEYSFENLGTENVTVSTLLAGKTLTMKLSNDRDSKIRINDFFNSIKIVIPATSGIKATNGTVHIVDNYVE